MDNLKEIIKERKSVILKKWLQSLLSSYPTDAAKFMQLQKDKFHNPVGQTFAIETEVLFDELCSSMNSDKINASLDNIIRIRAVQDFSPSSAVSFIFLLKKIIIEEISDFLQYDDQRNQFFEIESRIDRFALLAFEIYCKCREKIFEIRLKEIKKWSTGMLNQNS